MSGRSNGLPRCATARANNVLLCAFLRAVAAGEAVGGVGPRRGILYPSRKPADVPETEVSAWATNQEADGGLGVQHSRNNRRLLACRDGRSASCLFGKCGSLAWRRRPVGVKAARVNNSRCLDRNTLARTVEERCGRGTGISGMPAGHKRREACWNEVNTRKGLKVHRI